MEGISNTVKKAIGVVPSPDDKNRVIRLKCQVMPYGYGKKGSLSLAARLAIGTPENNFQIDEEQTYGEVNSDAKKVAESRYGWETIRMDRPSRFRREWIYMI
jgi:hypothetical protein